MKRMLQMLSAIIMIAGSASAEIRNLAEMNTVEIASLNREKTVVLIPGGLMEQHGPYLPAYADGYMNEWLTRRLAEALVERPGWTVLIYPTINVGSGSANVIGDRSAFPGSFDIRTSTLRSVFMDLADALGEQGFRWILPVHLHGYPAQNAALDQAGEYFHDTWGGEMVHLMGLMPIFGCCEEQLEQRLTKEQRAEDGLSVHGGVTEHSMVLFLRPNLVSTDLRKAKSWTGSNFAELVSMATKEDWPGYFGAPRHASAALGAGHLHQMAAITAAIANRILDGESHREIPRYATIIAGVPEIGPIVAGTASREQRQERRQQQWLEKKDLE